MKNMEKNNPITEQDFETNFHMWYIREKVQSAIRGYVQGLKDRFKELEVEMSKEINDLYREYLAGQLNRIEQDISDFNYWFNIQISDGDDKDDNTYRI
jgi:hypothetical protein